LPQQSAMRMRAYDADEAMREAALMRELAQRGYA